MSRGKKSDPEVLRQAALDRLRTRHEGPETWARSDVQKLVHELEVQHVELEMQNEELRRAQAEMTESEELRRRIFEALPAHIAVVDCKGRIVTVNHAWLDFAAQNGACSLPAVAEGANYLEVCRRAAASGEALAHQALEGIESVLSGASLQFTQEYPCHSPHEQRWFFLSVVPLGHDGQGGAVLTHLNISQQKLVEEELRWKREDLDRAQAVGQLGSWRLDTRNNVLTWSAENYRIFGLPQETPLNYQTFLSFVHPEDRDYVDERWSAALRGEPYDIEHRIVVDGRVKWVRQKAYLEFDAGGGLLGGFGISQDITARKEGEMALKQSEETLRSSETRLRVATQAAHMFSWECDVAARSIRWSENAAAVIGCSPHDLTANMRDALFFVAPDDLARFRKEIEQFIARRQITAATEVRGRGAPDLARHFLVHARILYSEEGVPLRILGVTQDITERKRKEEQNRRTAAELQAANEELTKFNRAMVGRELRMVELKREVNELCNAAGLKRRYLLDFEDGTSEPRAQKR